MCVSAGSLLVIVIVSQSQSIPLMVPELVVIEIVLMTSLDCCGLCIAFG